MAEARDVIRAGFKAFFQNAAGEWVCNSDRLNVEIERIVTWLAGQIDAAPTERIEAALAWVKRQGASPWIA